MTNKLVLGLVAAGLALTVGCKSPSRAAQTPKNVLVVSVTAGFRHGGAIDTSDRILPKLAQESGAFTLDWVREPAGKPNPPQKPKSLKADADDAAKVKYQAEVTKWEASTAAFKAADAEYQAKFKLEMAKLSPKNLKNYDAVIFDNTTGDLPLPDRQAFLDWVKSGKGFVGIHAATDTYHGFPGYIEMIGAEFKTHGTQVSVECINQDPKHPACKMLPQSYVVYDEIYQVKNFDRKQVHGLLTLDKHPNDKTQGDYPIAWCKAYGQGRVFYTALGHREDVWDPAWKDRKNSPEVATLYQQHLLAGIKWALGLVPGDATPQVK